MRIYAGGAPADSSRAKSKSVESQSSGAAVRDVSERTSTEKTATQQHRVRQGETLYSIAHAYGTTVDSIRDANPFLGERPLEAGDVLTIQR